MGPGLGMAVGGRGGEGGGGSRAAGTGGGTGGCRYSHSAEPAPVTVIVTPTAAMSAATNLALFIDELLRGVGRRTGEGHFHLLPGHPALTVTGGHAVEADLPQDQEVPQGGEGQQRR